MVKLMAPILSFTAEECWGYLAKDGSSVHLQDFPKVHDAWIQDELETRWGRLLDMRDDILKQLEIARKEKVIGHPLDALIELYAVGETYDLLQTFADQLGDLCIVSDARVYGDGVPIPADTVAAEKTAQLFIRIAKAEGEKCPRCWHYRTTIGQDADHPEVCAQCAAALS